MEPTIAKVGPEDKEQLQNELKNHLFVSQGFPVIVDLQKKFEHVCSKVGYPSTLYRI